jgi:hypothetical protein
MIGWRRLVVGLLGAAGMLLPIFASPAPASAAGLRATAAPLVGISDGQQVSVRLKGAPPSSDWMVVECGPKAIGFLTSHASPTQDGCEQRSTWVMPIDSAGQGAIVVTAHAVLTTAAGAVDCRVASCFVAAEQWPSGALELFPLSFSSTACRFSFLGCSPAADAWDPLLGARSQVGGTKTTPVTTGGIAVINAGSPHAFGVTLDQAPVLPLSATGATSVPGPYGGSLSLGAPMVSGEGEGAIELAMAAPGTSWGVTQPSSVVADVTLHDQTTHTASPTQQIVLFQGATPFTYTGYVGQVHAGDTYSVTVAAEPARRTGGLSEVPKGQVPQIVVEQVGLIAFDPASTDGLLESHAPVVYGRSTSALHDTPVLLDATATPQGGGIEQLSYTMLWSHEDAGTAFVPLLEWSAWGRLTDIESMLTMSVDTSTGQVTTASYLWGGVPKAGYPDSDGALSETSQPFPLTGSSRWWGSHPIMRDATGNNDFVVGTSSPFRFQLLAVPGPQGGATRESVQASYPFTTEVMDQELGRWYTNADDAATAPTIGAASQYAEVEVGVNANPGTAMDLRLEVGGTWYSSDLGWAVADTTFGAGRLQTAVKLPLGWSPASIQATQIGVYEPGDPGAVHVTDGPIVFFHDAADSTSAVALPTPSIVAVTPTPPPAYRLELGATTIGPKTRILSIDAADVDGVGVGGVPITLHFTGLVDTGCASCATETVTSGVGGVVVVKVKLAGSSGTVVATVPDAAAAQGTFPIS